MDNKITHPEYFTGIWKRFLVIGVILFSFVAIIPNAEANGIFIEMIILGGFLILIPLLAVIITIEATIVKQGFNIQFKQAFFIMLWANVISTLAGIPTAVFSFLIYQSIIGEDLSRFILRFRIAAALSVLIYLAVTILVELLVVFWRNKKIQIQVSAKKALTAVLAANALTYLFVVPYYAFFGAPYTNIRESTASSEWAKKPTTEIYYIDSQTKYLCKINSDGTAKQVVIPQEVKQYGIMPENGLFLYLDSAYMMTLYNQNTNETLKIIQSDAYVFGDYFSFSPNGKWVVMLSFGKPDKSYTVYLYEAGKGLVTSEEKTESKNHYLGAGVLWSKKENKFVVKNYEKTVFTVSEEGKLSSEPYNPYNKDIELAKIFSFSPKFGFSPRIIMSSYPKKDESDVLNAYASWMHFKVRSKRSDHNIVMLRMPRTIRDIAILPNNEEVVFQHGNSIYLLDVQKRRVGKITDGGDFVILSDKYSCKKEFEKGM